MQAETCGSSTDPRVLRLTPILASFLPSDNPLVATDEARGARGITIDPTGNIWAAFNNSGTATDIQEIPVNTSSPISWPSTYAPWGITSDGNGNIYFTNIDSGGGLNVFFHPGSITTPYTNVSVITSAAPLYGSTTSTVYYYPTLAADPLGRIWTANTSTAALVGVLRTTNTATITAYSIDGSGNATFTAANTYSTGQTVFISGLSNGTALNNQAYVVGARSGTQFTVPTSVMTPVTTTTDSGLAELVSYTSGLTSTTTSTDLNDLVVNASNYIIAGTTYAKDLLIRVKPSSTTSTTGTYVSSTQYDAGHNGSRATVLDGAGNVWFATQYPVNSSGYYGLGETSYATSSPYFPALSPTGSSPSSCTTSACYTNGGFQKSTSQAEDLAVDISGSVWYPNIGTDTTQNGTSITEIVGAAVPVVTPLSVAVKNSVLATQP